MKTMKTIALMVTVLFSFSMSPNIVSAELSSEMQIAISNTKKVEAKKIALEKVIKKLDVGLQELTDKYINKKQEEILVKKYEAIISKVDKANIKLTTSKSIYKAVTMNTYTDLKNILLEDIAQLKLSVSNRNQSNNSTTTVEQKEATSELVEKGTGAFEGKTQSEVREELRKADFTEIETKLLSLETKAGDGFEFCANFTADIYTNNGLRKYEDAQSEVAREFRSFLINEIPDYTTNPNTKPQLYRIQRCVNRMYGYYAYDQVTQSTVKALYEKVYNKPFKVHTSTFYSNNVSPANIEEYLENHHNR